MSTVGWLHAFLRLLLAHHIRRWLPLIDLQVLNSPSLTECASWRVVALENDWEMSDDAVEEQRVSLIHCLQLGQRQARWLHSYLVTQLDVEQAWPILVPWIDGLWSLAYRPASELGTCRPQLSPRQKALILDCIPVDRWAGVINEFENEAVGEELESSALLLYLVQRRALERAWNALATALSTSDRERLRGAVEAEAFKVAATRAHFSDGRLPEPPQVIEFCTYY